MGTIPQAQPKKTKDIETAALDTNQPISNTFEPTQGREQIVPIINSLVNDEEAIYQVNIPNTSQLIKGFPEDLVVECQGVVNGSGIHGISVPPFSPRLMAGAMIPRWKTAELMIEAARTQDRSLLLLYLLEDHRTQSVEQAETFLQTWLDHPSNEQIKHTLHK